jgi:hypothetical protein
LIEIIPVDDLSVDTILDEVKKEKLDYVLVLGRKDDGSWYFTANDNNPMKSISAAQTFLNYIMDA